MGDNKLTTPVVFFTFNRLENTKNVFSKIMEVKPSRLYLISDGPRAGVLGEEKKVNSVRRYLEDSVNWNCELIKDYAPTNMGCGRRIASGITKVFEEEDRAIFLEDDCVPDTFFFWYCQELLDRYEDNEEVMLISGHNPFSGKITINDDYLFSHVPNMWGWAAWRRSWQGYDFDISEWNEVKNMSFWKEIYDRRTGWALRARLDCLYNNNKGDIWDYQFICLIGQKRGYCIIPRVNLVCNIGFSGDSTHTSDLPEWMDMRVYSMSFPIKHPASISWTDTYDRLYSKNYYKSGWIMYIKNKLGMDVNKSVFKGIKGVFTK